jgi:hypothetical protein
MMKLLRTVSAMALGCALVVTDFSSTADAQNRGGGGGGGGASAGQSAGGGGAGVGRAGGGGGGGAARAVTPNAGRSGGGGQDRSGAVGRGVRSNPGFSANSIVRGGRDGGDRFQRRQYSDGRYRRGGRIITGLGIAGAGYGYYSSRGYSDNGYSCDDLEYRCDKGNLWACRQLEIIPEC